MDEQFTPSNAALYLFTEREGAFARIGHDLKLQAEAFEFTTSDGVVDGWVDVTAVTVVGAVEDGEVVEMSNSDKRKIESSLRQSLNARKHPKVFASGRRDADELELYLTVCGVKHAVVAKPFGENAFTGAFKQTEFGLKPYSAFLGSLRLKDEIRFEVYLDPAASPN